MYAYNAYGSHVLDDKSERWWSPNFRGYNEKITICAMELDEMLGYEGEPIGRSLIRRTTEHLKQHGLTTLDVRQLCAEHYLHAGFLQASR